MKTGSALEAGEASKVAAARGGGIRGINVFDLILRIAAIVGTLAAAAAMGTTNQQLPFVTQFVRFEAQYDDIDAFRMFLIVNAIICVYLVFSLPLSIIHIMRRRAGKSRIVLIFLDTVMLGALTGAASAAAAVVYLAHYGNSSTNWFSICQQYPDFCQSSSGSLIGSFGAVVALLLLVLLSAIALARSHY
nr:casparian strip membrane protein 2-like [Ipomoea batatas]GMD85560.1 casparian strip membrane protein 2-like [Ipomoea batatas]